MATYSRAQLLMKCNERIAQAVNRYRDNIRRAQAEYDSAAQTWLRSGECADLAQELETLLNRCIACEVVTRREVSALEKLAFSGGKSWDWSRPEDDELSDDEIARKTVPAQILQLKSVLEMYCDDYVSSNELKNLGVITALRHLQ